MFVGHSILRKTDRALSKGLVVCFAGAKIEAVDSMIHSFYSNIGHMIQDNHVYTHARKHAHTHARARARTHLHMKTI